MIVGDELSLLHVDRDTFPAWGVIGISDLCSRTSDLYLFPSLIVSHSAFKSSINLAITSLVHFFPLE